MGGLNRHQIANIALDGVWSLWWEISIGSDATTERRKSHKSVSVVLKDNAWGGQKKSVLDGAPPDCSWKKDDTISRWREVRSCVSEWRAS